MPVPGPDLPLALAQPLLDAAVAVFADLTYEEAPAVLRPMARFDRRRLGSDVARRALWRALTEEDDFHARVVARVAATVELPAPWPAAEGEGDPGGDPGAALAAVRAARDATALDRLVSWLWAVRPAGWELGLGAALALAADEQAIADAREEAAVAARGLEVAREAQRRAEEEAAAARSELGRRDEELRTLRLALRDAQGEQRRADDRRDGRIAELELALARAEAAVRVAEARGAREVQRADDAEALRQAAEVRIGALEHDRLGIGREGLAALADQAAALSAALGHALAATPTAPDPAAVADPSPRIERRPRERRARPHLLPGLPAEHADALGAMLRTPGVYLFVDGYNMSQRLFPGRTAADQRERLERMLERVAGAFAGAVVLVYDGDGPEATGQRLRSGIEVVFTAVDVEADDAITARIRTLPLARPVVVASSDRRVQEESEALGAVAVPVEALAEVSRRVR